MILKKKDRKEKLVEIYNILVKIRDNNIATEARLKVMDMLSYDGLFIFEDFKTDEEWERGG